jgi:mRNA-degrading endonuclease RelE of RelBE toxin-antitoxin system
MALNMELNNVCATKKEFCRNCNNQFIAVRPLIKRVIIPKHFKRDLKDEEKLNVIVKGILDCSNLEFNELHKFEKRIDGILIFRAKKDDLHIIYCVDRKMRIIFLRAIENFTEYKKFLDNTKNLRRIVEELNRI